LAILKLFFQEKKPFGWNFKLILHLRISFQDTHPNPLAACPSLFFLGIINEAFSNSVNVAIVAKRCHIEFLITFSQLGRCANHHTKSMQYMHKEKSILHLFVEVIV